MKSAQSGSRPDNPRMHSALPLRFCSMLIGIIIAFSMIGYLVTDPSKERAIASAHHATDLQDGAQGLERDFVAMRSLHQSFHNQTDLSVRPDYLSALKEARSHLFAMMANPEKGSALKDLIAIRENLARHEAGFDALVRHSMRLGFDETAGARALMAMSEARLITMLRFTSDQSLLDLMASLRADLRIVMQTGSQADAHVIGEKLNHLKAQMIQSMTSQSSLETALVALERYQVDLARLENHAIGRMQAINDILSIEAELIGQLDQLIIKADDIQATTAQKSQEVTQFTRLQNWLGGAAAALILLTCTIMVLRDASHMAKTERSTPANIKIRPDYSQPIKATRRPPHTTASANKHRIQGVRTRVSH